MCGRAGVYCESICVYLCAVRTTQHFLSVITMGRRCFSFNNYLIHTFSIVYIVIDFINYWSCLMQSHYILISGVCLHAAHSMFLMVCFLERNCLKSSLSNTLRAFLSQTVGCLCVYACVFPWVSRCLRYQRPCWVCRP